MDAIVRHKAAGCWGKGIYRLIDCVGCHGCRDFSRQTRIGHLSRDKWRARVKRNAERVREGGTLTNVARCRLVGFV